MKSTLFYLFLLFFYFPLQAQVTGSALLTGQTNNDGIQVSFLPVSLTGQSATATTDPSGFYTVNLQAGVYEVNFTKLGFESVHYLGGNPQFIDVNDTLQTVSLTPGIFRQISGVISGTLFEDTIYNVTGDLLVPNNQSLTIEPGTQVLFNGNYAFECNGQLQAMGLPNNPIVFTTNPNPSVGATIWKGIELKGSTSSQQDSAMFHWCLIENARIGINAINSSTSNSYWFELKNSVVRHTLDYGVWLYSNIQATIEENDFYNFGDIGLYLLTRSPGTIDISCNEIQNSVGSGIYSFDQSADLNISSNYIHDLVGNQGFGIRTRNTGGNVLIENNLIVKVQDGIQETSNGQNIPTKIIQNNLILNSDRGMVFTGTGGANIRMNVVSGCNIGLLQYATAYGTPANVTYNSFYNNIQDVDGLPIPGLGIQATTNNQGTPSDVWLNVFADPQLGNPNSYFPSNGSPLIDAGDPNVVNDSNGTVANIGLRGDFISCLNLPELATRILTSLDNTAQPSLSILVYPNPSKGIFVLEHQGELKSVEMYAVDGSRIEINPIDDRRYSIQEGIASGLYFLRLITAEGMDTQRLIVE